MHNYNRLSVIYRLVLLMPLLVAAALASTVTLPVEVMGEDGIVKEVEIAARA